METPDLTAVKNPHREDGDASVNTQSLSNHDAFENRFCFRPPLYIQRYDYVCGILEKYNCKTYVDIGCAECKLLRYLKNTNTELNLMIGIDIDQEVLSNGKEILSNSWFDYIQPRENPLEIHLIKGDISLPSDYFIEQACYENTNLDCVSMVEIIEHMYPDVLEKAMETVFMKLKPRIIIVTTPNIEYNIVFENLQAEGNEKRSKFRHWDHKFEWTRKEFQEWCEILLNKYTDYELICYDGLGLPPDDNEGVGHCSQIAIFQTVTDKKAALHKTNNNFKRHFTKKMQLNYLNYVQKKHGDQKYSVDSYFDQKVFDSEEQGYSLYKSISYPFETFEFEDINTRNKAVIEELESLIIFLTKPSRHLDRRECFDPRSDDEEVLTEPEKQRLKNNISLGDETVRLCSVEQLFSFSIIKKFKISVEELISLMKNNEYKFTKDQSHIIYTNFVDSDDDSNYHDYEIDEADDQEDLNDNSSRNEHAQFSDENWDDDIESCYKPIMPTRVFSPEEQFADDFDENEKKLLALTPPVSDKSGMISEEENFSSFTNSTISTDLDTKEYEINYRAFEVRKLASQFRKIKRRLRREEKEKLKAVVQNDCTENEQFFSEF